MKINEFCYNIFLTCFLINLLIIFIRILKGQSFLPVRLIIFQLFSFPINYFKQSLRQVGQRDMNIEINQS
ncbi:unnamed protein product [Paramecium sonneborni]|uniref:Uncharacterized protein n=1 Tax=Paramecium sonneborni TaxID=65129 RepID=A0A8S1PDA5_9CILI|nr:unnamed protein product [Paramecium sonneborni]